MMEHLNKTLPNEERSVRIADIFKKYQAQLRGFIARRVSSKEDSEDILQNVFYQFMKNDQADNPIEQISAGYTPLPATR